MQVVCFWATKVVSVRKVRTIFNLNIRGQLYLWEKELLHID